jgi:ABC-type transport system involved in multi-copper enzyme maturation permease subunit
MLKTIAWKEVRELLPFIALTLLAEVYFVCNATGTRLGALSDINVMRNLSYNTIPFIDDFSCTLILFIGGCFAVVVALWQTMWETSRGTFLFLLHRSITRNAVISTKLAVGVVLSLLVCGVPLLYYALWAATPGSHDSPFAWSMTTDDWFTLSLIPTVYLGAFISGLRSAHWFASRFFPIFAASIVVILCQAAWASLPTWRIAVVVVSIAIEVAAVYVVLYLAKVRDYS